MSTALTALEREVIRLTAAHHWPEFHLDGLGVVSRDNTGAGRYVYLEDSREQRLPDGSYTAPGRMIQMEGVGNGLGFVVEVSASRINHIELFTYGNQGWDGVEREWKIL
ncbi:MAG TPA: hypothetical protein VFB81_17500 [Myxococcales bacterium]|nr:hypothetical protein [Myxococcales bacterium]